MKHIKRVYVLIGLLILVVVGLSVFVVSTPRDGTVSGYVTRINNECYVDGTCSITIDDKTSIITGCGLRGDGTSCPTFDQSKLKVGDKVEAKYHATKDYNDLGCSDCSITKLN